MHFTQNTVSRPVSPVRKRYHSCHMSVFFPRRQPAPDMSLGLIDVQNLPRLFGKRRINLRIPPICSFNSSSGISSSVYISMYFCEIYKACSVIISTL